MIDAQSSDGATLYLYTLDLFYLWDICAFSATLLLEVAWRVLWKCCAITPLSVWPDAYTIFQNLAIFNNQNLPNNTKYAQIRSKFWQMLSKPSKIWPPRSLFSCQRGKVLPSPVTLLMYSTWCDRWLDYFLRFSHFL